MDPRVVEQDHIVSLPYMAERLEIARAWSNVFIVAKWLNDPRNSVSNATAVIVGMMIVKAQNLARRSVQVFDGKPVQGWMFR